MHMQQGIKGLCIHGLRVCLSLSRSHVPSAGHLQFKNETPCCVRVHRTAARNGSWQVPPRLKGASAVDQATQTWALISHQGKQFAVPLDFVYAFKPERKVVDRTAEDVQKAEDATKKKQDRVDAAFRKKFNIVDDTGAAPPCIEPPHTHHRDAVVLPFCTYNEGI